METLHFLRTPSPVEPLFLAASAKGLVRLEFEGRVQPMNPRTVQLQCWRALLDIAYGETRSYGDLARAIGHPHAFRAVGMSNNRNPIAIVVPCHRVIAADGSLCGYGGGLDIKRKLLDLEQAKLPATRGLFSWVPEKIGA